jgi:hypothetical protein
MYATILREIPAYVAQFTTYEFLKRKVFSPGSVFGPIEGNFNFNHYTCVLSIWFYYLLLKICSL